MLEDRSFHRIHGEIQDVAVDLAMQHVAAIAGDHALTANVEVDAIGNEGRELFDERRMW